MDAVGALADLARLELSDLNAQHTNTIDLTRWLGYANVIITSISRLIRADKDQSQIKSKAYIHEHRFP